MYIINDDNNNNINDCAYYILTMLKLPLLYLKVNKYKHNYKS